MKASDLWSQKPLLRSPDSYIPAVYTAQFLKGKHRILLVGDAGGREWQYLTRLGKEIYTLDLSPQKGIPNLYLQSIERPTPFPDQYFDGVVMNEVLEHLFHDVEALEEANRILKKDGVLVVTVPYYSNVQDEPEFHVRVYSFKTIRRLLENCGFQIEEHFFKGFCSRFPQLSLLFRAGIYLTHKAAEISLRKSPDEAVDFVNGFFAKLERSLGSHSWTIKFQSLFSSYGGVLKAVKSKRKNFDEIQKRHFSNSLISMDA